MSLFSGIPSILPRYEGKADMELFLAQQNLVVLNGLRSSLLGGGNLNTATTTVDLLTLAGVTLSSATMTYATGSAGRYEGTLPVITSLVEGIEYFAQIKAVSVATTVAYWKLKLTAVNRRE